MLHPKLSREEIAQRGKGIYEVDDNIIVSSIESERLAQEKIEARIRLLAMPIEAAQKLANQTLQPQYWKFDPSAHLWDESIPTHYGEDTYPS